MQDKVNALVLVVFVIGIMHLVWTKYLQPRPKPSGVESKSTTMPIPVEQLAAQAERELLAEDWKVPQTRTKRVNASKKKTSSAPPKKKEASSQSKVGQTVKAETSFKASEPPSMSFAVEQDQTAQDWQPVVSRRQRRSQAESSWKGSQSKENSSRPTDVEGGLRNGTDKHYHNEEKQDKPPEQAASGIEEKSDEEQVNSANLSNKTAYLHHGQGKRADSAPAHLPGSDHRSQGRQEQACNGTSEAPSKDEWTVVSSKKRGVRA